MEAGQDEPFRFMDLPPELRIQVYGYLLITQDNVCLLRRLKADHSYRLFQYDPRLSLATLHVSRSIYKEAAPVLYSGNTFEFLASHGLLLFVEAIGSNVKHLRRLNLRDSTPSITGVGILQTLSLSARSATESSRLELKLTSLWPYAVPVHKTTLTSVAKDLALVFREWYSAGEQKDKRNETIALLNEVGVEAVPATDAVGEDRARYYGKNLNALIATQAHGASAMSGTVTYSIC